MENEKKTSMLGGYLRPSDKDMVERLSRKHGVNKSEYLRGLITLDALLQSDIEITEGEVRAWIWRAYRKIVREAFERRAAIEAKALEQATNREKRERKKRPRR